MLRKLLITLTILLSLPAMAQAWSVNAKTSPITGQGIIEPAGNKTYATGVDSDEYTVLPAAGYRLLRVTLDGVAIAANGNGKYVAPYLASKSWRYIVAYFTANTVSISTTVTGSGAIREDTNESLVNIPVGSNRQLLVLPNPGYVITSLTADDAIITDSGNGTKTVIYNNLQSDQKVLATFAQASVVTVDAGNDVTVNGTSAEFAATLYGSATSNIGPISYAWTGTGLSFGTPNMAGTTVFAALPGTYTATLTITSGAISKSDSLAVTVTSRAAYLESLCSSCHAGTGTHPATVIGYDASKHKTLLNVVVTCQTCHDPGNGGHYSIASPVNSCANCHVGQYAPKHSATSLACLTCHDAHNPLKISGGYPHFSNFTTAQYVTRNITCDNCHMATDQEGITTFNVYSASRQWARSAKGNPKSASLTSYDFKTLGSPAPATPAISAASDCVRCHTTTGYINYVSSNFQNIEAWGTSGLDAGGDRTREMIVCSTCHNPTPFLTYEQYDWDTDTLTPAFSRRKVPWVIAYYNYSTAGAPRILKPVTMPDSTGDSNNCIACHSGRVAGSTLRALALKIGSAADFWNNTPLIDPHGMSAAGILYQTSGYHFIPARTYAGTIGSAGHRLGSSNPGPCVACHMSTDKPHLFSPISSASDGTITKITAFDRLCGACHNGGIKPTSLNDPASINAKKQSYISSLKALSTVLAAKGIYFNPVRAPYFFSVSDPAEQTKATAYTTWKSYYVPGTTPLYSGSDLMGAAFNLRLLWSEQGAYTHNSSYIKRLIYDSIDLVDNGKFDYSTGSTIQNLPVSPDFGSEDRDRAGTYVGVRP